MKLLKTKGRICNVPAIFIYFNSIIINFQITLLMETSRCNKQTTSLALSSCKFWLTNFHKISIFQLTIVNQKSIGWRRRYFFVFREKAWGQKETFVKYRQSQG